MKHDVFFSEDTHTYLVDYEEVPSVTEILKPLTSRGYAEINPVVLEAAAARGTAVHEACEAIDYGLEADVYPEIEGYVAAYEDWLSVYRPEWEGIEQVVVNQGYAGTADRIGRLAGSDNLCVLDLKTSSPTKEALVAVCLQTYAYADAIRQEMYPEDDEGYESMVIDRYALFLMKDGKYRFVNCKEYEEKYGINTCLFLDMLDLHEAITKVLNTKARKKSE